MWVTEPLHGATGILPAMRPLAVLLCVLVAGCPRPAPVEPPPKAKAGYPGLICPEGAVPAGLGPPDGIEAYCVKRGPTGNVTRHGPYILWHYADAKASQGEWFNGKKAGVWNHWHTNGNLEKVETWRDGQLHGPYEEYAPTGTRITEGTYQEGKQVGPWRWWHTDGSLMRTGQYVDGAKDGEWLEYDTEGNMRTRRIFRQGRQLSQEFFLNDELPPPPPPKPEPEAEPEPEPDQPAEAPLPKPKVHVQPAERPPEYPR